MSAEIAITAIAIKSNIHTGPTLQRLTRALARTLGSSAPLLTCFARAGYRGGGLRE
jgi:hypothetical protein